MMQTKGLLKKGIEVLKFSLYKKKGHQKHEIPFKLSSFIIKHLALQIYLSQP